MIERVEATFALMPERLIGDIAYGGATMLAWLVDDKGIEPHVPVWDKTQRSQWRAFKNPRDHITHAGPQDRSQHP